jgi:hypothetical protein
VTLIRIAAGLLTVGAALALTGCAATTPVVYAGTVVDKPYTPSEEVITPIGEGLFPITHPAVFRLALQPCTDPISDCDIEVLTVDERTWNAYQVGDTYPR